MRPVVAALLLGLAPLAAWPAAPADDGEDDRCTIEVDPDDLFAQDRDLVVPAGRRVADAVAIRGNVVVKTGARVKQVVALGGDVVLEDGATVEEDAVAIGGDVRVLGAARVGSNALSIGGEVRADRARVDGDVFALAFSWGGTSLEEKILEELKARGRCVVRHDPD
jgi:NDP-sugar pyrophosphorylase family protein